MTRQEAKKTAFTILARWEYIRTTKQGLIKAVVHQMAPPTEVSRGRRALLRALAQPVRL